MSSSLSLSPAWSLPAALRARLPPSHETTHSAQRPRRCPRSRRARGARLQRPHLVPDFRLLIRRFLGRGSHLGSGGGLTLIAAGVGDATAAASAAESIAIASVANISVVPAGGAATGAGASAGAVAAAVAETTRGREGDGVATATI